MAKPFRNFERSVPFLQPLHDDVLHRVRDDCSISIQSWVDPHDHIDNPNCAQLSIRAQIYVKSVKTDLHKIIPHNNV